MKKQNLFRHCLSILTVCLFIFIAYGSEDESKLNSDGSPKTERQNQIESQFSSWDGSHINLTKYIKNSMNDPDSYEHVETTFTDLGDHILVLTTFRGKNAFGGVVTNYIKAEVDINGNVTKILDQGN